MIENLFAFRGAFERRYKVGPVAPHIEFFATFLLERGQARANVRSRLGVIRDVNFWLIRRRLNLRHLGDDAVVTRFLKWRRQSVTHLTFQIDRFTVQLFLEYLRAKGVLRALPVKAPSKIDLVIQRFSLHLKRERGLTEISNRRYCGIVREFLEFRFRGKRLDLRKLRPRDAYDFTLRYSRRVCPKTASIAGSTLRTFFRFLHLDGLITIELAHHVPTIPDRRNAEPPRYLKPEEIQTILNSCNRTSRVGKRDYAILLMLARYGLRAAEVRKLTLDDIDWHSGTITVRGKGHKLNKIPIFKEVGAAIVEYLKTARPQSPCRHLFLRTKAPIREITDSASISTIVHRAIKRTNLRPPYCGAHIFRHSLGTQALRNGASLREVGHLLRHHQLDTVAIYAKVDFKGLSQAALPWPGPVVGGAK